MIRRAVLIFARSPEAEAAAKHLPIEKAARLFRSLLDSWLDAARACGATPIIASSTPLLVDALHIAQRGTTFGERLANSSCDAWNLGIDSLLIAGIDAPPPRHLDQAFVALENGSVDAVVAPAHDGGLNLIGLRRPAFEFLSTIGLRDRDLLRRCRIFFPSIFILPTVSDVDSLEDVAAARHEQAWAAHLALLSDCLSSRLSGTPRISPTSQTFGHHAHTRAPPLAL
jgi:glycosyltransferase A (GT-A) superfamily protein (DUF2064 family)